MARIRSIKPEFWKSDDIARLSWDARLIFIALWSYVDDNGVGRDNAKLIAAELFPLEEDPIRVLALMQHTLDELARESRITRYTHDGKGYLFVNKWEKHQKIDRPNKSRYPKPGDEGCEPLTCGNLNSRADDAQPSRNPRAFPSPGAVELGSRGTEDQGVPPTAGAVAQHDVSAQTILAEYLDHVPKRPPQSVIGQVAKHVKAMLEEGIDPDDVRRGCALWASKSLHPATLPSVVNEVMNAPRNGGKASTTDTRVQGALALAAQYREEDGE